MSRRPHSRALALALLACLALVAAGCGGDDEDEATPTTTTTEATGATGATGEAGAVSDTVDVTFTGEAVELSPAVPESLLPGETVTAKVPAGTVTFEVTNEGPEPVDVILNLVGNEIPLAEELAPGDSETTDVDDITSGFHVILAEDDAGTEVGESAQIDVE